MKKLRSLLLLLVLATPGSAQMKKEISISFVNAASAYPFAKFGQLFSGVKHPGIELGYGFIWKSKSKHDWYQEIKLAWVHHRFVQNAFLLYTDVGYRYKLSPHWTTQLALGAGYLHSIPATAKLKLNANGEYKNNKGIGRAQAGAILNFGAAYTIQPLATKPLKIFIAYQQLLQTPFVKAYVPILPYNSLLIGCSIFLPSHQK